MRSEEVMATTNRPPQGSQLDMSGLDGTVGFLLKRAQLAVSRDISRAFADFDITAVQYSVLTVVHRNPGIAQGDVAAALEVERPRMVPVLDKLEQRGLAVRRPDPADARSRRIQLTPRGSGLLDELTSRFSTFEQRVGDLLGEADRARLLSLLRLLADRCGSEQAWEELDAAAAGDR